MTLKEAIESGRPFRANSITDNWIAKIVYDRGRMQYADVNGKIIAAFDIYDLTRSDYELKPEPRKPRVFFVTQHKINGLDKIYLRLHENHEDALKDFASDRSGLPIIQVREVMEAE